MEWDDIYLEGYWQTEKYFQAVSGQVREAFSIDRLIAFMTAGRNAARSSQDVGKGTFSDWLMQIGTTESVSVHIRRGDYLLPQNQELFGGICTEAYYRTAMDRMVREHPGCVFYLFTNDKEWACGWATDVSPVRIVELSEGPDGGRYNDYAEFALMSKCRHQILANSSFSWWASYLNQNPHKTVLAPDRWLNGWDCEDIYRADMRKITL